MSVDETPTTSDEEFIVSDSEIEEEEIIEKLVADIEDLKQENKLIKKELQNQSQRIWELSQGWKETWV